MSVCLCGCVLCFLLYNSCLGCYSSLIILWSKQAFRETVNTSGTWMICVFLGFKKKHVPLCCSFTWIKYSLFCFNHHSKQLILTSDVFSSCCLGTWHTFLKNSLYSDILWVMWIHFPPKTQPATSDWSNLFECTVNVAWTMVDAAWIPHVVMCMFKSRKTFNKNEQQTYKLCCYYFHQDLERQG